MFPHRFLPINIRYVPEIRHVLEPLCQHGATEQVNLGEGKRFPTERPPRDARGLYSAEKGYVSHDASLSASALQRRTMSFALNRSAFSHVSSLCPTFLQ